MPRRNRCANGERSDGAAGGGPPPLAVMLATMRRAHAAAKAAEAQLERLAGRAAVNAARAFLDLRARALAAAKPAAPYVHARKRAAAADDRGARLSHEAALAALDRRLADHDRTRLLLVPARDAGIAPPTAQDAARIK